MGRCIRIENHHHIIRHIYTDRLVFISSCFFFFLLSFDFSLLCYMITVLTFDVIFLFRLIFGTYVPDNGCQSVEVSFFGGGSVTRDATGCPGLSRQYEKDSVCGFQKFDTVGLATISWVLVTFFGNHLKASSFFSVFTLYIFFLTRNCGVWAPRRFLIKLAKKKKKNEKYDFWNLAKLNNSSFLPTQKDRKKEWLPEIALHISS